MKATKGEAPSMSNKEMAQIRENLEGTPDLEEAAELMGLAGNSTRLKLLYLLENMEELNVSDLAEMLGVSVSAVSQHLAKLKAYGLVAPRRDAQTIYYRLTTHGFNDKLRGDFFPPVELCFPAWARVTLVGEADRPISELRPGDLVLSWDGRRGALAQGRITRVITGAAARLIRVNGGLMASAEHRILTARGYVRFTELRVGDLLFRFPGTETEEVRVVDVVAEKTLVYNLDVSPNASFFAEGLVVEDFTGEAGAQSGLIGDRYRSRRLPASKAVMRSRPRAPSRSPAVVESRLRLALGLPP